MSDDDERRPGRAYEKKVHRILKNLCPDSAEIRFDDKVYGQNTGTMRKIEITIRWPDPLGDSCLMIVDAKDRNKRVGIQEYGSFENQVRDVGATKGLMISTKGFTPGVIRNAKKAGIKLLTTVPVDLNEELTIPVVVTQVSAHRKFMMKAHFDEGDTTLKDEIAGQGAILSDNGGETNFNVMKRFNRAWNNGELPRDIDYEVPVGSNKPISIFVRTKDGEEVWRPLDTFDFRYRPYRTHYLKYWSPVEAYNIIDSSGQEDVLAVHVESVNLSPVDDSWEIIEDPGELAVKFKSTKFFTVYDTFENPPPIIEEVKPSGEEWEC